MSNGAGNVDVASWSGSALRLVEELGEYGDELAERAYERFSDRFPKAREWSEQSRARFRRQARGRFDAVLAVMLEGADVGEALSEDLQLVGAQAAQGGSSMAELAVMLRISRDVIVELTLELAEDDEAFRSGLPEVLGRLLPAVDALTDALSVGYWTSLVDTTEESRDVYAQFVENLDVGVYEVDLDGFVRYANPALAHLLARDAAELEGERLTDVIITEPRTAVEQLMSGPLPAGRQVEVNVVGAVSSPLQVEVRPRIAGSETVGYQGIVRSHRGSGGGGA